MNEYDSDKMADVLGEAQGYEKTNDVEEADLIVFNTCSVREKAQEKVFSDLGRIQHLKAKGVKIAVGGCVASQEGDTIIARAPYVDVVFGPQTLHRLPKMLDEKQNNKIYCKQLITNCKRIKLIIIPSVHKIGCNGTYSRIK